MLEFFVICEFLFASLNKFNSKQVLSKLTYSDTLSTLLF